MTKSNEDEKNLFADAMKDVMPLSTKIEKISTTHRPPAKKRSNFYLKKVKRNKAFKLEVVDPVSAHEPFFFQRTPLNKSDQKALKKGLFNYFWQLDLHGYTLEQAEIQLVDFLEDALNNKQKHVLIIHGKGYNSDTDYPKLKNLVNQVLSSWPNLIAFCSAQPKDGGTGATYVFLKYKK